jgi:hypothetical protein
MRASIREKTSGAALGAYLARCGMGGQYRMATECGVVGCARRLDRIACSPVSENAMQFQIQPPAASHACHPDAEDRHTDMTMVAFHAAAPVWRARQAARAR